MATLTWKIKDDLSIIEFDQEDSKVNLLTSEVLKRLETILEEIKNIPALTAVVILSKKKDIFIAGADIREIEWITSSKDGEKKSRIGQRVLNRLEDFQKPTIAVIDGAALGGGCELALACQYRLATFSEKVKIGLPEVNLGLIPGFGGTYRLPRLVGLTEGLKMIVSGKPVAATKALKIGLVDRLVPQEGLESHMHQFLADIREGKIVPDKYQRRKQKGKAPSFEESFLGQWGVLYKTREAVLKSTKGFYPAPLKAISVVYINSFLGRKQGLAFESKAFGKLVATPTAKNLIQVFYLTEKFRKFAWTGTEGIKPREIVKCGVVGAGVMGGGIAQLFSAQGIWTRLKDIQPDALKLGLRAAAHIYQEAVNKGRLTKAEAQEKMARISPTLDYRGFGNADIIVEAVVENMDVKKKVFKELSEVVGEQTILATNTSALSVTELSRQTRNPSRVIGLHFFNPAHRMPLIEIIRTPSSSSETMAAALNLVKALGKTPVVVKDSCGFLVNRILLGYVNEAGRILEESRQIERIDKVMTDFGMPMGPFTLSDEVGVDVGVKVLHILHEGLGERFKPVGVFDKIYEKGLLGKKSGKGFYIYGETKTVNPQIHRCLPSRGFSLFKAKEALNRMLHIMINEAARCLEEGIVEEPSAVDVAMILGTGFPAFRGGLLCYADAVGISPIITELETFQKKFQSDRFQPSTYLLNLKKEGKGFF